MSWASCLLRRPVTTKAITDIVAFHDLA